MLRGSDLPFSSADPSIQCDGGETRQSRDGGETRQKPVSPGLSSVLSLINVAASGVTSAAGAASELFLSHAAAIQSTLFNNYHQRMPQFHSREEQLKMVLHG